MRPYLAAARLGSTAALWLLREDHAPPNPPRISYENEGSDRVSRGSITLTSGGWWFAKLVVPMAGDQSALLTIGRQGPGARLGPEEATLVVPPGEADAMVALLTGIIRQARSDGVLRDRPGRGTPGRGAEGGDVPES